VGNDRTVGFGKYGRVNIDIVFKMKQVRSLMELSIVRDGNPTAVTASAKPIDMLVHLRYYYTRPAYFIYCDLVFQPLFLDYINEAGSTDIYINGLQRDDWKRAVFVTQVLSDRDNILVTVNSFAKRLSRPTTNRSFC
jgi:hypothetical protein